MNTTNIWQKVLNSNEEVKYEFSVGKRYRKFWLVSGLAFSLFLFLCGLLIKSSFGIVMGLIFLTISCFIYWYKKIANAYAFTDRRVLIHRGWLSTSTQSVDYTKITEVSVVDPIISRLVTKSGHMSIHTGNIMDAIVLKYVENPYEIKKKLDSLRHI